MLVLAQAGWHPKFLGRLGQNNRNDPTFSILEVRAVKLQRSAQVGFAHSNDCDSMFPHSSVSFVLRPPWRRLKVFEPWMNVAFNKLLCQLEYIVAITGFIANKNFWQF